MAIHANDINYYPLNRYYFCSGVGGVWVHLSEDQEVRDHVILVVRECIWNALVILLDLPTFDDTGSLGYPPRCVIYHPLGSTLVTVSRLLVGNGESELKLTTFSSFLLFSVFPGLFFFCHPPSPPAI